MAAHAVPSYSWVCGLRCGPEFSPGLAVDQAASSVKTSRGVPLGSTPAPCLHLARAQPWLPMGKEGCQGAAVSSGESCPVPGLPNVPVCGPAAAQPRCSRVL